MGKDSGQVQRDEHDDTINAKKVSLVSSVTVNAVVNTGAAAGNTTVEQGTNPWLSSIPSGTTVFQGTANWLTSILGNVTIDSGTITEIINPVAIKGNLTIDSQPAWADPNSFIGLATVVPSYGSNVTVHTQVLSADGAATIFEAPASNRFWLKNLHVASLGASEVEIRSGATTLIPFTSLATGGGYFEHFGNPGLPSRAQADALVVNLNGAATVSVMANWYAAP